MYVGFMWRHISITQILLCLLLTGCVSLPSPRSAACDAVAPPELRLSEDGRTLSTTIDVLTYNIAGLPKVARRGRAPEVRAIGERLAALRERGEAPEIVMFQEVFTRSARRAVIASGYPTIQPGPSARDPQPRARDSSLPGRRSPRRGEIGVKLASSGIVIASEYPVVESASLPFAQGSCAGLDCLSNKGLVFARIFIPGVPVGIDLFNTHMNSSKASRVPSRRHLAAHQKQSREAMAFVAAHSDPQAPTIFGGDFNMRGSEERFEEFARWKPLTSVHRHCLHRPEACDVRMSWDGDEPWMDTQLLQFFRSGTLVTIRPVRVEAMFDGGNNGSRLSDHDGFRVSYEITWPANHGPGPSCPPIRPS